MRHAIAPMSGEQNSQAAGKFGFQTMRIRRGQRGPLRCGVTIDDLLRVDFGAVGAPM